MTGNVHSKHLYTLNLFSDFGLACHLGVLVDIPALGVAKTLFQVDGLEKNEEHKQKVLVPDIFLGGEGFEVGGLTPRVGDKFFPLKLDICYFLESYLDEKFVTHVSFHLDFETGEGWRHVSFDWCFWNNPRHGVSSMLRLFFRIDLR